MCASNPVVPWKREEKVGVWVALSWKWRNGLSPLETGGQPALSSSAVLR